VTLTLSRRLAAGAATAVAFAVVLASVVVYLQTRHVLRAQVDDGLRSLVPRVQVIHFSARSGAPPSAAERKRFAVKVPDGSFGGPSGVAQAVAPDGKVVGKSILPARELRSVKTGALKDIEVDGNHLRVLATKGPEGDKLVVARSLAEVDSSLKRLRIVLLLVGLGGVGLAAGLGLLVARGAIGPVRRLTAEAEHVAETQDLSRRMQSDGDGDEVDRLSGAFNTMLAALERSREAQRQLVADASHELRTPLTSIRTNIELLGRAKDLPEPERAEIVAAASAQLQELTVLVGDLVDMARDGRPAPDEVEDVRLDELVRESAGRINGGRIQVESEPSLVRGSRGRLARAVGNLLDNAIKYSPDGSVVEVTVRAGEIAVRDHGPGIAPDDLPHVFDRFYRAPSARGTPGSGLGLAIVRQVAEAHRGTAVAEAAEGGGARLRLRLPALMLGVGSS
jgi:two-component system, OmpR family, sensor histidine kinase MprB